MTDTTIEHIGILVPDLEAAIDRWSAALGYTFSPIARYRTDRYVDLHDPAPHHHDARIAFSREGSPRIELMEVTGAGTHGPDQVGVHHLGIQGIENPDEHVARLAETTDLVADGVSYDDQGRALLCFTEKSRTDGVRIEFVAPLPGPIVADDGSPLPLDPRTGRPDLWANAAR